jgi:hypothetical protein
MMPLQAAVVAAVQLLVRAGAVGGVLDDRAFDCEEHDVPARPRHRPATCPSIRRVLAVTAVGAVAGLGLSLSAPDRPCARRDRRARGEPRRRAGRDDGGPAPSAVLTPFERALEDGTLAEDLQACASPRTPRCRPGRKGSRCTGATSTAARSRRRRSGRRASGSRTSCEPTRPRPRRRRPRPVSRRARVGQGRRLTEGRPRLYQRPVVQAHHDGRDGRRVSLL